MAFWKKAEGAAGRKRAGTPSPVQRPTIGNSSASNPNGNGETMELSVDQLRKMAGAAKAVTAAFGEIVALVMRSPQYQRYSLADLRWLVLPALQTGQFAVTTAQSKSKGLTTPIGVVLWARVSKEIDQRLSAAPEQPLKLEAEDWKSGDIPWVILALGEGRVLQGMLQRLQEKQWSNKPAKMLRIGKDGKPKVATIDRNAA